MVILVTPAGIVYDKFEVHEQVPDGITTVTVPELTWVSAF
jgi:hypothetical protein